MNLYLHCAVRLHGLLFNWADGRPIFIFALPHLEIFLDFHMFLPMYSAGCVGRHVTETPCLQHAVTVLLSSFILTLRSLATIERLH